MPGSSPFVASWIQQFRHFLVRRRFSRHALKHYFIVARAFLRYLEARGVNPTVAQPSHTCSYLKVQLVRYRRRQQRAPLDLVDWRSHHTAPIHQLLRCAQGQWPPPSDRGRRLAGFTAHLRRRHFSRSALINYRIVAHRFLAFLERRAVTPEQARPADLAAFIADEHRRYRGRHGREPKDLVIWRCSFTGAVHELLRWTQGRWPPPPTHPWYEQFRTHMYRTCSHRMTRGHYVFTVGKFLAFLGTQGIPVEAATPAHVEAYRLLKLREYRQRHGHTPTPLSRWRWGALTPIS